MKVPVELREWLRLLAKRGIMGATEHEVAVALLRKALYEMIGSDYIRNFVEQRKLLKDRWKSQ